MKKSSLYILALVALVLLGGFYLLTNRPKADTPPPPPPNNIPTITSFTATPAKSPSVGSPVTLAWTSTGATGGCTLVTYPTVSTSSTTYTDNPPPSADCSVNSSKVVNPTVSTYYTLFVYGPQIFTPTYNSASSVIYVEVPPSTPPSPPVVIESFSSDKQVYNFGENVILNWATLNARNCKIYKYQDYSNLENPTYISNSCSAANVSDSPQIPGQIRYIIDAFDYSGVRVSKNFNILVNQVIPKITSFTASPTIITNAGDPVTLSWITENASNYICNINGGVGNIDCNGSKVVNPTSTTYFTLSVTGPTDVPPISQSLTVSVTAPPTTHDLSMKQITATPNPVVKGSKLTIKYTLKNNGSSTESNVVAKVMYGTTQVGPSALIKSLAPGASYTIPPFTVVVPTSLASKEYNLTASVTPAVGEKNITDNQQTTRVTVQ